MTSTTKIKNKIYHLKKGKPFTNLDFLEFGTRASIDKTISRMVQSGDIERVATGVYVRPLHNRIIGTVKPSADEILRSKLKARNETLQPHGAEALRFFRISTQVPIQKVYYTDGSAREIKIEGITIKLIHTNDKRKLAHAGTIIGLAISALWYLGKEEINIELIKKIHKHLTNDEFNKLLHTSMPAWMRQALLTYQKEYIHGI